MAKTVPKLLMLAIFSTIFAIFGPLVPIILKRKYVHVVKEVVSFNLVGHM